MIRGFKHKGLEKFLTTGTKSGIQTQHTDGLRVILARLSAAVAPADMNLPGLDLHQLKGDRKGTWTVKVSGNWRVTFRFDDENVADVDYEDYH